MKRELVIFIVLFSLFVAIGCTSNTGRDTQEPATPADTPSIPIAESATPPVSNATVIPADETSLIPFPNATAETPVESKIIEVSIKDFAFNPEAVTISADNTVRWKNLDSTTHTVKGPDFESNRLREGDSYAFIFTKAGVYEYKCSIHPSMKGTVTVTG